MKKIKTTQGINSDAFAYVKQLVGHAKVLDAYVQGKWLKCELSSGVRFGVKNESFARANARQNT